MSDRRVPDRNVVLAAVAVVVGVIAFAWLTDLVPGLRDLVALQPLVIVGLIAVTSTVLVLALMPRRSS